MRRPRAGIAAVLVAALFGLGACVEQAGDGTGGNSANGNGSGNAQSTPTSAPSTVINYRVTHPEWLGREHMYGHLTYPMSPPAGGNHNPYWMNCMGDVYPAEIAKEHAVHSLEHGAVWVTYRPDLPADQVAALASRVQNVPYMFMSPYPQLDRPISLQAWGYQLKVDSAGDPAIDSFIDKYRILAAPEPGATCSQGVTDTGADTLLEPIS
jgi:hypothetical protein